MEDRKSGFSTYLESKQTEGVTQGGVLKVGPPSQSRGHQQGRCGKVSVRVKRPECMDDKESKSELTNITRRVEFPLQRVQL